MLWHGAHHDDVGSILSSGLRGAPGQPTVTDSREGAELHAQKRDWTAPKVLEIHVPADQADRYLDEPEQGTPIEGNIRALRATLPPEFIHAVHDAAGGRTRTAVRAGEPGSDHGLPEDASKLGTVYHSTPFEHGFPHDDWMHVGTRHAAEDRAHAIHPSEYDLPDETPVYMHSMRLRGRVYPKVISDDWANDIAGSGYADEIDEGWPSGRGYHVFPYSNHSEGPAQLSYLVHKSAIVPQGREEYERPPSNPAYHNIGYENRWGRDHLHVVHGSSWAPSSGIFAPTTGLDQRLFEGGSLRPMARAAIMERLDRCIRVDVQLAGTDWQQWLHVWIAGGSASEWAGSRPNDEAQDLDVIVGLDLAGAQGNSSFEGMDQAQAATALNAAFRHCFNETGWRPEFGGTWDLTAYCNPHVGSDITVIRPYAAWDLSDWDHPGGSWSVRPPHLPGHTLKDFDPAVIAHGRAVLAEARAILRMPEPLRTREARSLWEHVHEHRCQAFSAEGEGWTDPGNVDEKMLAYAPRGVLSHIRDLAMADPIIVTGAREEAAPEEQDYWTSHRAPGPGHTGQDDKPRASVPYHETAGRDPDDLVDVYRAAPEEADTINRGDWVTLHGDWARERAENSFEHHVLHARVPARHVWLDAAERDDDEAGYHGPPTGGISAVAAREEAWEDEATEEDEEEDRHGNGYASRDEYDRDGVPHNYYQRHVPGEFYHGTNHEFRPGDQIRPGHDPVFPNQSDPTEVYFTEDLSNATGYAHKAVERKGTGAPHVYRVSIQGEPSHDRYDEDGFYSEHPLTVLHEHHSTQRMASRHDDEDEDTDRYVTCDQGHDHWGSAGAAGLLIRHQGRYLLQHRSPYVQHGGTWSTPGGALRHGEEPEEGARREAEEEFGSLPSDLKHHHTFSDDHGGWAYHTVVMDSPHQFSPHGGGDGDWETQGHGWFTPEEMKGLQLHPGFAASWAKVRKSGAAQVPEREVREYEGTVGDPSHITRSEEGLMPTSAVARLAGNRGEIPGEHRNRQGGAWEDFKRDIAVNGIRNPIFITVDHGQEPVINEGNHRRDAAVELGLPHVPVEVRYFGHAEREGLVQDRGGMRREGAASYEIKFEPDYHGRHRVSAWPAGYQGDTTYGEPLGSMQWHPEDGTVTQLHVRQTRSGVGTALWRRAQEEAARSGIAAPAHSPSRTPAADAWAQTVGGETPPLSEESQDPKWIASLPEDAQFRPRTAAYDPDSRIVRSTAELGWGDEEWADARREPWHAAARLAQHQVRFDHPKLGMQFPDQHSGGDEMVGRILGHAGYRGDVSGAFVARHPHPEMRTSNPSWLRGAPGVALHPERWDYGTVAHEAAHHAVMYDHAAAPNEYQPDEQVHGPEWAGHYASALSRISKGAGGDFLEHHRFYRGMIDEGLQWKRPSDLDAADRRWREEGAPQNDAQRGLRRQGAAEFPEGIRMVGPEEYGKYQFPDYPPHRTLPALGRHLRRTNPAYYERLRADVEANGVGNPVLVRFPGTPGYPVKKPQVMDGHHRGAVASELGIDIPVGDYHNDEHHAYSMKAGRQWWRDNGELKAGGIQREAAANLPDWHGLAEREPNHAAFSAVEDQVRQSHPGLSAPVEDATGTLRRMLGRASFVLPKEEIEAAQAPPGRHDTLGLAHHAAHVITDSRQAQEDAVPRMPGEKRPLSTEMDPDDRSHGHGFAWHYALALDGAGHDDAADEIRRGHAGAQVAVANHRHALGLPRDFPGSGLSPHMPPDQGPLPEMPDSQRKAMAPGAHRNALLDVAKNPEPGTRIWRGERRETAEHTPDAESVGMHWSVHPANTITDPYRSDESERPVLWQARLEHPAEQAIPRSHRMWRGQHMSMDNETEVRLRPGSSVHVEGAWVGRPGGGARPVYPLDPGRNGPGWEWHPVDRHVPVSHRPGAGHTIDYSDVGIPKEAASGYENLTERSGMIYLDIPEGKVRHLPGGVDDHHITLVYLGKDVSDDAFAEACRRARKAAAEHPPMEGSIGGLGSFPPSDSSDGKKPVFVPVDVPGIGRLRKSLEDLSASEHKDYKAHVTLAYLDGGEAMPAPHPTVPVSFGRLHVKRGDEIESFPFGGPSTTKTAALPRFFHGTDSKLNEGDLIVPGRPKANAGSDPRHVYFTERYEHAEDAARGAASRHSTSYDAEHGAWAHGEPSEHYVYEVKPTGEWGQDQQLPWTPYSHQSAHPLQVVRDVTRREEVPDVSKTAAWDHSGSERHGVYLRFGDWPHDEKSYSPAGGYKEEGVSVYDLDRHGDPSIDHGLDRGHVHDDECDVDEFGTCQFQEPGGDPDNDPREEMRGRVKRAEKNRYYGEDRPRDTGHLVKGDVSGVGYDGEPLLKNVRRVGDWIDHRHLFLDQAHPHRLARDPAAEDYEEPEEKPPYSYRSHE